MSNKKQDPKEEEIFEELPGSNLYSIRYRDRAGRTHSEFIKLADHLISSNPEAIVPAVPPSLTSAGAGTDEDEARVKNSIQRWRYQSC